MVVEVLPGLVCAASDESLCATQNMQGVCVARVAALDGAAGGPCVIGRETQLTLRNAATPPPPSGASTRRRFSTSACAPVLRPRPVAR